MDEDQKIIQSLIESLLNKMGIDGDVAFMSGVDVPVFVIETSEAGILIGEGGKNLLSLSHILRKITQKVFEKKEKEIPQFSLDVNGYYTKRINNLKEEAKMSAQRVLFFKKEIELDPMNAYERRIVHTVLGEYPDIITESVGEEGIDRRIVIKPVN